MLLEGVYCGINSGTAGKIDADLSVDCDETRLVVSIPQISEVDSCNGNTLGSVIRMSW